MHDVLEGILPLETKLLQNFIYQGVISTPELNEAIESFTYGPTAGWIHVTNLSTPELNEAIESFT